MIFALKFYITAVLLLLCLCIIITNVFPLFPFVPTVPEGRDSNIKADTKCKSTNKDARDEDAVAFHEGVVKGVGQCHCVAARGGGKDFRLAPKKEYFIERPITRLQKFTFSMDDVDNDNNKNLQNKEFKGTVVKIEMIPQYQIRRRTLKERLQDRKSKISSSNIPDEIDIANDDAGFFDDLDPEDENAKNQEEENVIGGKTVFTETSYQNFFYAEKLQMDEKNKKEISIRLVGKK